MQSFDDYEAAAGRISATVWLALLTNRPNQWRLCGTLLKSGQPVYYLMPTTADDDAIQDAAFLLREDRRMSETERWAYSTAQKMRAAA